MTAIDGAIGLLNAEQCGLLLRRDKFYFGPVDFDVNTPDEQFRIPIPTERMPWVLGGMTYSFEEASNAGAAASGQFEIGYEKEGVTLVQDGILPGNNAGDGGRLEKTTISVLGYQRSLTTVNFTGSQAAGLKARLDWPGMVVIPKGSILVLSKTSHSGVGTEGIINGYVWGWEVVSFEP